MEEKNKRKRIAKILYPLRYKTTQNDIKYTLRGIGAKKRKKNK